MASLALASCSDQAPSNGAPNTTPSSAPDHAVEPTAQDGAGTAPSRAVDPPATGSATPFVTEPTWPAWAQWPRALGTVTLFHPLIEEWRGEQLFTRSAIECEGGLTGLVTLQWMVRFDGRVVTLATPTVATCAWDGDPARVEPCRTALDRGLEGCTWSLPIQSVLSLVSTDTMPPEPTVEQADDLRRGREFAAAFGTDLLNDREAIFMLDRWPRDEEDHAVMPTAAVAVSAPCGTWTLGPLRVLGRDGRVHELRAARWIRLGRDGWTAPTTDNAGAQSADPAQGGSLSEARARFERTVVRRDKVYGLLDRSAYRWHEAVARTRPQVDPPPPELPPNAQPESQPDAQSDAQPQVPPG
jgi:hypothetical protein